MEFTKLDAGLASAVGAAPAAEDEVFLVSVRLSRPLTAIEQNEFRDLGGIGCDSRQSVMSARLSRAGIEALSNKPWVRSLSLSRRLKPL
jgi:hypothetical protein